MNKIYATSRDEVVVGARIPHLSTGGRWTVIHVNADGSVFARSDMGARRTVSAENVEAGLRYAITLEASK